MHACLHINIHLFVGSMSGGDPGPSGEHVAGEGRAPPVDPLSLASIQELEDHIDHQIRALRARRPHL